MLEKNDQSTSEFPRGSQYSSAVSRLLKYTLVKTVMLFFTVAVGLYLTIVVINLGGYVDRIFAALIDEQIGAMIQGGWLKDEPEPGRTQIIEDTRQSMQAAAGLNQPFMLRSLRWLFDAMTLDLGKNIYNPLASSTHGASVQAYALVHLPYTLVVVGSANVLVFLSSLFLALMISRHHNSFIDRLVTLLTPLTSAPSWIHGILLVMFFAGTLRLLPYPRAFDVEPIENTLHYFSVLLPYLVLPVMAVFLSVFFQNVYAWRSFFLIYADEPYVDLARAKGLPSNVVESRYILRPTLPYVITNFTLMVIGMWQGAIALELFFRWPGIASLFLSSVKSVNTPLVLAIVVIFAYMLAISVWLLDIFYALVDPRVRIGGASQALRVASPRRFRPADLFSWLGGLDFRGWLGAFSIRRRAGKRSSLAQGAARQALRLRRFLADIAHYPSAVFGLVIVLALAAVSLATVLLIPYDQAVSLWRAEGGDWYRNNWYANPRRAMPAWVNGFRRDKLPPTIRLNSQDERIYFKAVKPMAEGITQTRYLFKFDFNYAVPPSEVVIYLDSLYAHKSPYVSYRWLTPDGRWLDLGGASVKTATNYYIGQDERLQRKLNTENIVQALFLDPDSPEEPVLVPGSYQLEVKTLTFEPDSRVDFEIFLYGRVYGVAGTDSTRRDLSLALLWGTPVALAFGILGAIATNVLAMLIAASGAWYGGWLDELIQRITEVNLILPVLPIAILVYMLYSKSIWVILGVVVLLNIFGSAVKNYRAVFLQVKEASYVEAAQAYGASSGRLIRRYLVPHVLPVLIPQLVITVPGFVFYESTLAYLGVSDPYLPTWGKVIYEALTNNALLNGYYYWLLEPISLLILTGLAFVLLGFSLDRVLNPRLRVS